jgi:hypothetical protein
MKNSGGYPLLLFLLSPSALYERVIILGADTALPDLLSHLGSEEEKTDTSTGRDASLHRAKVECRSRLLRIASFVLHPLLPNAILKDTLAEYVEVLGERKGGASKEGDSYYQVRVTSKLVTSVPIVSYKRIKHHGPDQFFGAYVELVWSTCKGKPDDLLNILT